MVPLEYKVLLVRVEGGERAEWSKSVKLQGSPLHVLTVKKGRGGRVSSRQVASLTEAIVPLTEAVVQGCEPCEPVGRGGRALNSILDSIWRCLRAISRRASGPGHRHRLEK